jgi:NAD(P)-dependent dehydrogenase (short-subunit alcohol dehydrogenase family)
VSIREGARRRDRRSRLRDRVVVVTGGSRGLGLKIARQALDRGARVGICGTDEESLDDARRELFRRGDVAAVRCDVADPRQVEELVATVEARLGEIDVLVANAGVITVGPFEHQTVDDLRMAMDVMYWGVVHPVMAVLPGMRRRHSGNIAVVTSVGGRIAVPHLLPYSAAKFAAVGFSEGLSAELAGEGIRVTTVIPGLMRTGSHVNAFFKGRHRREYTWFALAASLPLLSVDVRRAARRILDGVERGAVQTSIGPPAAIGSRVHGLMPATTVRVMRLADRLLPGSGGIGEERRSGARSTTPLTESPLTALGTTGRGPSGPASPRGAVRRDRPRLTAQWLWATGWSAPVGCGRTTTLSRG